MPLDVLGRTRATLIMSTSFTLADRSGQSYKACRCWNRFLKLLILNKEFLVSINHQFILIMSLPFVHTARRSYRLSVPVNKLDLLHA